MTIGGHGAPYVSTGRRRRWRRTSARTKASTATKIGTAAILTNNKRWRRPSRLSRRTVAPPADRRAPPAGRAGAFNLATVLGAEQGPVTAAPLGQGAQFFSVSASLSRNSCSLARNMLGRAFQVVDHHKRPGGHAATAQIQQGAVAGRASKALTTKSLPATGVLTWRPKKLRVLTQNGRSTHRHR